jgi:hypothetical protein
VRQDLTAGPGEGGQPIRKPPRGTFAIGGAAAVKGLSPLATTRAMSAIAVRGCSPP